MTKRSMPRLAMAMLAFLLLPSARVAAQDRLAFTQVTVVDVATGRLRPHQTVLVEGNRIAAVGRAGAVRIPDGASVIDGSGTFMIPGLWDMHVHTMHPWSVPIYFPFYVALGVTGVREMGNSYIPLDSILAVRRRVQQGTFLGPRFVAAGHELDAEPKHWPHSIAVRDAEHGRQLVDSLTGAGADFLKVYENLPRDVYYAIVERARQVGVRVVGHVPQALTPAAVSDAGQRSIEHQGKITESCTRGGDDFFAAAAEWQDLASAEQDSIAAQILRGYEASLCAPLFQRLVRNGTWIVPTLATSRGYAFQNDSSLIDDPRYRFSPPGLRRTLWNHKAGKAKDRSAAGWELQRRLFRVDQRVIGDLHRAGVRLLAGSDAPNPFAYYGFGIHDELALLVEAGLTPAEALRTATLNPAVFLAAEDSLGTVAPGKLADLVLLEANPLDDIRNTQRIRAVIVNGRHLDRETLDALIATAEKAVNQP